MEMVDLFWAIVWSVVALLALISIFWNPCHFFTLAISVGFAAMFFHDYRKHKDL